MINNLLCLLLLSSCLCFFSCGDDPASSSNTPPTASFTIAPSSGYTLTTFSFDASGSSDNEDPVSSLLVRWDWENDGKWDTEYSTTKSINHKYSTLGTKTVKLEIKDTGGLTNLTTRQLIVTTQETGTVTDIDGNVYQTVKIGNQWWMAENLKVIHYRNGDALTNVTDSTDWSRLFTGAYCSYDNDEGNVSNYGRLYNWYAVNDSRNIAPAGWHVPTDEEWKQLEMYLGMNQSETDDTDWRGTTEGGKLKETGTIRWNSPNTGANNEYGFSALPGGYRIYYSTFGDKGDYANFWSSTKDYLFYAWFRRLHYNNSGIYRNFFDLKYGFSVRCVKDQIDYWTI